MSVQGVKAIRDAIEANGKALAKGVRVGLHRAGLFLQRESQKIVPIDTGALRESAHTRMEGRGLGSVVVVGYSTDYAVPVHEDLDADHSLGRRSKKTGKRQKLGTRHMPGKLAKYLEKPLREKADRIAEIVVEGIREAL